MWSLWGQAILCRIFFHHHCAENQCCKQSSDLSGKCKNAILVVRIIMAQAHNKFNAILLGFSFWVFAKQTCTRRLVTTSRRSTINRCC